MRPIPPTRTRALVARLFARDRGPLVFVAGTVLFALGVTTAALLVPWALGAIDQPSPLSSEPPMRILLGALIASPLVENLLLIGLIEFMRAVEASAVATIVVVATLSGVVHAVTGTWQAVAGFVLFATMAKSYLAYLDVPFGRRYALLYAQHALFNLPATIVIAAGRAG